MPVEEIEKLRLQSRARTIRVKVGEKGILRFFQDHGRVETRSKSFGQLCFSCADRTFDRDVAEVQSAPMISSRVVRTVAALIVALCAAACASAPPAPPPPKPPPG